MAAAAAAHAVACRALVAENAGLRLQLVCAAVDVLQGVSPALAASHGRWSHSDAAGSLYFITACSYKV